MSGRSKARQELDKDRDFILWIFDYKCVKCGAPYAHIHEIRPISHGKISLEWRNRVPLCGRCHSWAHDSGTNRSIPILQEARKLFLIRHFELGGVNVQDNQEVQREDL